MERSVIGSDKINSLQRQIRLLVLLDAAEKAGLTPMRILCLHTFAFLSNILAPVWDLPTLDGKVLKRHGGPFYPTLQHDLDRLVGKGIVIISELSHVKDEENHWRLEGSYRLNRDFADQILKCVIQFQGEHRIVVFLQELAFALSALSDEDFEHAMLEDATYADPIVDVGNVVNFTEYHQNRNYSAKAANYFQGLLKDGASTTPGEKLHFYIRHLHERIHGRG